MEQCKYDLTIFRDTIQGQSNINKSPKLILEERKFEQTLDN